MEYIKTAGIILAFFIQIGTVATLIATLKRFLDKPSEARKAHEAEQDKRISDLEVENKEIMERLNKGDKHFESVDAQSKVMMKALLALVDHAIDNNHKEKLVEVGSDLQAYLIEK